MRSLVVVAALTLAVGVPATGAPAPAAPSLAASGCPLFPAGNVWHADVSRLPVHPRSEAYLAAMGRGAGLHADVGSAGESDPGPDPVPPGAPVEGGPDAGGDRHVLVVQAGTCRLYELFDAHREGGGWRAGTAAPAAGPGGSADPAGARPPGVLLQLLAGLLGLVAAALAMRQLACSRRGPPPGRHARSDPAPADRDQAGGRRR